MSVFWIHPSLVITMVIIKAGDNWNKLNKMVPDGDVSFSKNCTTVLVIPMLLSKSFYNFGS